MLRATVSAPGAPAAVVTLSGAGSDRVQVRRTGGSYLSASDDRVLFGLTGARAQGPLVATVRWPNARTERFLLAATGRYLTLVEGSAAAKAPIETAPAPAR